MRCAWKELLEILPQRLRREVDQQGRDGLQELRLRFHAPPELVLQGESRWLQGNITREELSFVVNAASRYSPWAAESMFIKRGVSVVCGRLLPFVFGWPVISRNWETG